uniref:Ig-like domain-containing protein n=1 Tax=Poecilia mexicana TaxID=48701 RepID=A0A3B3Y574_9TELE
MHVCKVCMYALTAVLLILRYLHLHLLLIFIHIFFHFLFSLLYLPALFTEVPRDVTTQIGEDVEMACSFHGAGSPSFSLEIQWWYIKNHKDSQGLASQISNTEMPKDATKISVVKVAGSNISHKLRLSGVKPADEGTYECHVIDHSGPVEQRYRVQAYLRVEPDRLQESDDAQLQELEHPSRGSRLQQNNDRELRKRSAHTIPDCRGRCVL